MKKRIKQLLLILLVVAIAYLTLYPVPIDPEAWTPGVNIGFTGIYSPNNELSKIQKMADGQCPQCEDLAIDSSGNVYASASDGRILAFSPDFKEFNTIVNTGGRPLGMITDNQGNIYVADDTKGLLWVSTKGEMKVLSNAYNNQKMLFVDDLTFAPDSSIIFTEASRKFPDKTFVLDIIEHRPNGNMFRYYLKTGKTELLMDSLYFANGVAVSADGSYVLVNNMNKYQVLKHFLSGENKGKTEVFADNLPGFPDGVNIGPDGIIWVSIPTLRIELLDKVLPYPFLRKLILRIPQPEQKKHPYGFILGFDSSGKLIHNLQDPTGGYSGITNVVPFQNKLYLGSINEKSIGIYELPKNN
ncbi:SMP-30/gluconolactonase/LRE family protein [Emticicia sp. SJ17W-69]|uniref:SMP-30/gluconolactonase/LRE family protein n=1 Tax=Emticicia sp. SJ17W-69 TaxID=3421657 RepID=UPI003EBEC8AD